MQVISENETPVSPCAVGALLYFLVSSVLKARGLEGTAADPSAWEVRMAAKYFGLLFKEYALADLSR